MGGRRETSTTPSLENLCFQHNLFGASHPPGYSFVASSFETLPLMMTSWPGFQFTGVEIWCLAVSCMESSTRSTSSKLHPARHRVNEHELDFLIRTNHEDVAHGGVVRWRAALTRLTSFRGQHVVKLGDLELRVADHRIIHLVALRLFDVRCPLVVTAHGVHAQPDVPVAGSPYSRVR